MRKEDTKLSNTFDTGKPGQITSNPEGDKQRSPLFDLRPASFEGGSVLGVCQYVTSEGFSHFAGEFLEAGTREVCVVCVYHDFEMHQACPLSTKSRSLNERPRYHPIH